MDGDNDVPLTTARAVLRDVRPEILGSYGVLAVGAGLKTVKGEPTDEPSIKAFVARKLPLAAIPAGRAVPPEASSAAGTVPTDVAEMSPMTGPPWVPQSTGSRYVAWPGPGRRHRPLSGGDSVSHPLAPLGTVGTAVVDAASPGRRYILSCNHVLAALNGAWAGEPVVQPASADGGTVFYDTCGFVERWVPIRRGEYGSNRVDAAIARVWPGDVSASVDWLGAPVGVRAGRSLHVGETVWKVGRTTLLTSGTVVAVEVSGWIVYPDRLGRGFPAFFEGQVLTTGMCAFGDSGSLLFDSHRNAVGLLFGGSPTHTFYNDILDVQDQLGVRLIVQR